MTDASTAALPAGSVLGVDVGGTKTHLALGTVDGDGRIVREAVVPTPSWRTASFEGNAEAIVGLLVDEFGDGAKDVAIGVGAHGCDSTAQCQALEDGIRALVTGPVRVLNDGELMPWAMGVHGGVGVVVGTGSIAVARDDEGRLITAGGWGWVLGDEGSSAGIVREATRAVLAELDLGRRDDPLVAALFRSFDVPDGPSLAMEMTRDNTAERWGRHSRDVFAAAEAGSQLAATVIDDAADSLAGLLDRLHTRGVAITDVVAGGAVVTSQPRLRDRFVRAVESTHPGVTVSVLSHPPVVGALALAADLARSQAHPTHDHVSEAAV